MSHLFLTWDEILARKQKGDERLIVDEEPRYLVTFKTPPPGFSNHHYEHVRATQVHAGDYLEPLGQPEGAETVQLVMDVWHKQNRSRHSGWTEGVGGVMIELTNSQNIMIHNGEEKVWVLRK